MVLSCTSLFHKVNLTKRGERRVFIRVLISRWGWHCTGSLPLVSLWRWCSGSVTWGENDIWGRTVADIWAVKSGVQCEAIGYLSWFTRGYSVETNPISCYQEHLFCWFGLWCRIEIYSNSTGFDQILVVEWCTDDRAKSATVTPIYDYIINIHLNTKWSKQCFLKSFCFATNFEF